MRVSSVLFLLFAVFPRSVCLAAPGETIVYDVKTGPVRLGRAVFHEVSENSVTFETRVANFYDLENISCDPDTFLPVKIERDVRQWPGSELITEAYDQKKFVLTIGKKKGAKKEVITIQKGGPIQNAILLPYYVRRIPDLAIGFVLEARLPTRDFTVKLVSVEDVRVPAGTFKAYHFASTPRQFEIWISADKKRIPVKITGSGPFGYSMLMKEYRPK